MLYTIRFTPHADKSFLKLPKIVQNRILKSLAPLRRTPRPRNAKKLAGEEGYYRLRVGDYRVIYSVLDEELLVLVVKVGHRKNVYRGH